MILAAIEMVPKKVYAAAVAALLAVSLLSAATIVTLRFKVVKASAQYSQLETKVANEAAARERAAREDALEVSRMQAKHASLQQESVHAFREQAAADARRAATDRADLDVLRDVVRTYAAGGGEAQSDGATCRGERDRSQRLGALVGEALELQGEAESFIRQRDREVKFLKDVITNDRTLTPERKEPQ
jgi:hypothetical protein